jgi:HAD superfamily hydrolase (TIGR01509 family)
MLAGVIFDFDGVIVDSHPVHLEAWKAFFSSIGKEIPDQELAFVLEGGKREEILRHFLGELDEHQIKVYGEEKQRLFQQREHQMKIVRGFVNFLAELKLAGFPVAIATSGSRRRVEHTLELLGLRHRFGVMVTGDDVSMGKPDPALFLLAAQGLQLKAGNILVCEDAVSGVVAAKAAGMKCLAVAANGRGPRLKKAGADIVIEDFTWARLEDIGRLFAQA